MSERKKLLLIDLFGLMYKFFFTLPRMSAPDGRPTNAVYGLARVLTRVARDLKPDYMIVALESKVPTFRHQEFEAYKAHRDRMPDDLREQIPIVIELLDAMGLTPAQADGFEADDVIGTYAKKTSGTFDVSIITGDRDLLQLVDDSVRVLMSRKGVSDLQPYDAEAVKQELGVTPEHVPDKKGLEGDSSDNIPGVPGIGPKTAAKLLEQFPTLDELYARLNEVEKENLRKKLDEFREQAYLSRKLATIARDVPVTDDVETYRYRPPDAERMNAFFRKYGITSMMREVKDTAASAAAVDAPAETKKGDWPWRVAQKKDELEKFLRTAEKKKILSIDLETTGLNTFDCGIVGYAMSTTAEDAIYVPVGHVAPGGGQKDLFGESVKSDDAPKQIPADEAMRMLRPILEDASIAKMGHNLKYDAMVLAAHGVTLRGIEFDSMIASYLLDSGSRRHGLKFLAQKRLGIECEEYSDIVGKGKDEIVFSQAPLERAGKYACGDVSLVARMRPDLEKEMKDKGLETLFREFEMPLVDVLVTLERNGVRVDVEYLERLSKELRDEETRMRDEVKRLTGHEINLNSPKQVGELLFDRLGLSNPSKGSTDISVLEQIAKEHEAVPVIIRYRHLSKLRGTYVDALPKMVQPSTGRIHTSFNQVATSTGRLSSSDPNLQNIPIRTDEGREIRQAFVAPSKQHRILSADYSQVEIRLLAHVSEDPILIESFASGEDIHTRTASEVLGVPMEKVTSDMRRYAKTINFGIIYGMKEYGLSQALGIGVREAADYIRMYFSRYPAVQAFIERTQQEVMETGFVSTVFGRRREIPEVKSTNRNQREFGLRAAVNARLQGTAADIMKLAMIEVHRRIEAGEIDALMVLQVHDELVFEVAEDAVKPVASEVRSIMQHCADRFVKFKVPLLVDVSAGQNWLDTTDVKLD